MPEGKIITAPLLKITWRSRPSSRITSSTTFSFGSQVATMTRPTDSGATRRRISSATSASGGGSARARSSFEAGR